MRKPQLTEKVMAGLSFAYSHTEADYLSDFEEKSLYGDLMGEFEAAGKWLTEMFAYRQWRKQQTAARS